MQTIQIIGNLTAAPETRSTNSGVTVCSFTVAVDRKFKDQSGNKTTDFFRVNAWRQLGEMCGRYLDKGRKVYVRGELQARTYEDKKGTTRLSLDVQADEVEFLSAKQEKHDEPKEDTADMQGFTDITSDDLPF
jgi:single-strand DNA-binding protein